MEQSFAAERPWTPVWACTHCALLTYLLLVSFYLLESDDLMLINFSLLHPEQRSDHTEKNNVFIFGYVDFHPSCSHSRLPVLPLCRLSDNLPVLPEKDDDSVEEQKKNEEVGPQEEKKKEEKIFLSQPQQQTKFLSTARGLFQGNASTATSMPGLGGSNLSTSINRRRIFSLEPFHQSSIISSRLKRGREEEREEEDQTGNHNKKTNGKSFRHGVSLGFLFTDIITLFILSSLMPRLRKQLFI